MIGFYKFTSVNYCYYEAYIGSFLVNLVKLVILVNVASLVILVEFCPLSTNFI